MLDTQDSMDETAVYQLGSVTVEPKFLNFDTEESKNGKIELLLQQSQGGCFPCEDSSVHQGKVSGTETLDKGYMEYGYV